MSEQRRKINVCVVGLGNCCTSLVSGVVQYAKNKSLIGLNYEDIGGYKVDDINFVLGFDVDKRKVGKTIAEAIQQKPNCTPLLCNVDDLMTSPNVSGKVYKGPVLDGCPAHMRNTSDKNSFFVDDEQPELDEAEIAMLLKANAVNVLITYLPTGSQKATEFWAHMCLKTGIPMKNCIPVFIASTPEWAQKFKDNNLCILGDDIKSQAGSSILSSTLQALLLSRGLKIKAASQMNAGGNSDFLCFEDRSRLASKKISKENVIRNENKLAGVDDSEMGIYAGPSAYIPYLGDTKVAHIRIDAENFGGQPIEIDLKLSTVDSANSAGIVIDAIRFLRLCQDLGMSGPILPCCAVYSKTPPVPMKYEEAKEACDELARTKVVPKLYEGLD
jgi:myo-inositol-1-phosphate synthase